MTETTPDDGYCRAESCRWRNWRSGSAPTHRRGEGCPTPDDAARAEAERYYWANPGAGASLPGYVGPFMAGAAWQREQLRPST